MAQTPVLIVGAGPSGLALGLSLAKHGVLVRLFAWSGELPELIHTSPQSSKENEESQKTPEVSIWPAMLIALWKI